MTSHLRARLWTGVASLALLLCGFGWWIHGAETEVTPEPVVIAEDPAAGTETVVTGIPGGGRESSPLRAQVPNGAGAEDDATVPIAAGSAPTLRGLVLDREGTAVPEAGVRFLEAGRTIHRLATNRLGRFQVPVWLTTRQRIIVTSPTHGHASRRLTADDLGGEEDLVIVLAGGDALCLHVVDQAGIGIDGALVVLETGRERTQWNQLHGTFLQKTAYYAGFEASDSVAISFADADGEACVHGDRQLLGSLVVAQQGYLASYRTLAPGEMGWIGDIVLSRGGSFTGSVTDTNGSALAAASVELKIGEQSVETVTDETGMFSCTGLAEDTAPESLGVAHPEFSSAVVPTQSSAIPLVVTLPPRAKATLLLLDGATGAPAQGTLSVRGVLDQCDFDCIRKVNPTVEYALDPGGQVLLERMDVLWEGLDLSIPGYLPLRVGFQAPLREWQDLGCFTIWPEAGIYVSVVDAMSGTPIEDAMFRVVERTVSEDDNLAIKHSDLRARAGSRPGEYVMAAEAWSDRSEVVVCVSAPGYGWSDALMLKPRYQTAPTSAVRLTAVLPRSPVADAAAGGRY